ncbi:ribosome small subunit-dependent GTPase A [Salimicrobium jeotgali]|uniref:Small ribosomal subunit biogenesis GTPase RsgA n=1 Tax=Salimicrobium jeotgali TaxID=1230341 RepID=K2H881_9BACI|nr:ribosome small subunit-dependent GTPase A [Salimicrobium jeotgali]AKG04622.1 ribosome small subunit-dependent GTPase A [Salimicrobium jeotgali]EKE31885.1 GTPase RsgA [Salimicrobium jeotgali]MBM7696152.1 ribosome biogenesis GTPase [Salimicrobium jeotgali]
MARGIIIQSLSGFYDVLMGEEVYRCRGRGLFRNKKISPLVGDVVQFDPEQRYLLSVEERSNELIRPPIANIDQAIVVVSAVEPKFNSRLLDRFLVLIEAKMINPVIVISKQDRVTASEDIAKYRRIYEQAGYEVILTDPGNEEALIRVKDLFKSKTTVIAGQSGVGKSTLLNALQSSLFLETGEISRSLGRGKHTTRRVELFSINGGLVADTPGFSSLDFDPVTSVSLAECFPEIREYAPDCKFRGCIHDREPKCAVKQAVEDGNIHEFRYDHYIEFLHEIQNRKPRY